MFVKYVSIVASLFSPLIVWEREVRSIELLVSRHHME